MDLNAPLGLKPPPKRRGRGALVASSVAVLLGLAGIGFFFATADPHGGEPYAIAPIVAPQAPQNAASANPPDPTPTGSLARNTGADPGSNVAPMSAASIEGGIKVFRGGSAGPTAGGGPLVIDVSKAMDEQDHKSSNMFSSAPVAAKPTTAAPKVAIFVSGMGLSAGATRTAVDTMPAGVDLAFVPYGDTIAASVASAKSKGHEILLQLPMQTGKGAPPGPHALSAGASPQQIADDFAWLSGRYSGYAGVTNLLGAPVTSDTATMTTLLKTVGAKGLFYLDDGTSKGSVSASVASNLGVAAIQTDIVLDATGDPDVVLANLNRLVAIAKQKGQAVGMASGLPQHLGMIARFAGDLGSKGVTLVPISAMTGRDANVAASR